MTVLDGATRGSLLSRQQFALPGLSRFARNTAASPHASRLTIPERKSREQVTIKCKIREELCGTVHLFVSRTGVLRRCFSAAGTCRTQPLHIHCADTTQLQGCAVKGNIVTSPSQVNRASSLSACGLVSRQVPLRPGLGVAGASSLRVASYAFHPSV